MRFSEIDIFGVFVSPVSVMLPAAWIIMVLIRRLLDAMGLWRHLWHPALAGLAVYVLVLSAIVIGAAAWGGRHT